MRAWARMFLAAILATVAAEPAAAQMFNGLAGQLAMDRLMLQGVVAQANRAMGDAGAARAASSSTVRALPFRRSAAVTTEVRDRLIEDTRRRRGERSAAELRAALGGRDWVGERMAFLSAQGLDPNDLSDVIASYWVTSWRVVNGAREIDGPPLLGVRDQVRQVVAKDVRYQRMGDLERQRLADTVLYAAVMREASFEMAQGRRNHAALEAIAADTRSEFQRDLGLDLSALRLTNDGFSPKG